MFSFSKLRALLTTFYKEVEDHIATNLFRLRIPNSKFATNVYASVEPIKGNAFHLRNTYRVKQGKYRDRERYIVCSDIHWMYSGLGALLRVLAPCWIYAKETGRTLIIDWRGNPYTKTAPNKNLFPLLFQQPEPQEIGVSCIADDSISELQFPQPILAPEEVFPQPSGAVDRFPNGGIDTITLRRILISCVDVEFPTVIPSLSATWYASGYRPMGPLTRRSTSKFKEKQRLYQSLRLKPEWELKVSEFYVNHMSDQPVVGVHIRHGNGEGLYRSHFRNREIQDFTSFMDSLADKIRRYAFTRFGKNYTVFLCTDSDDVVKAMKNRINSIVSRCIWRPPSGEGVDFDHAYKRLDGGIGSAVDALIDMQLLAKCDVVLTTRKTAFTSHIPYVMDKRDAVFLDHWQTANI